MSFPEGALIKGYWSKDKLEDCHKYIDSHKNTYQAMPGGSFIDGKL